MSEVSLFPYQKRAVDLVVTKHRALVAYEMGLGKTCIAITSMERLMDSGHIDVPVLVVALSSLTYQWQDEIAKFAPQSRSIIIDGTPTQRREKEKQSGGFDYVITTYDMLVRDKSFYLSRRWGAVILDECVAIKSFQSKRSRIAKSLRTRIRVGLTGTPITNGKAEEIFSIMEFVDPQVLGSFRDFENRYIRRHPKGWISGYRNLPELHKRLSKSVARKRQTDPDVRDHLPEVLDMEPRLVSLDRAGLRLYKRISRDCKLALDEAQELFGETFSWDIESHYGRKDDKRFDPAEMELRGRIMQCVSALRMVCDHPALLSDSADDFERDQGGSEYCAMLRMQGELPANPTSPKIEELKAYLRDLWEVDPDTKVVVFTSFTRTMPYIERAIHELGKQSVLYHGGMSAKEKDVAKKKFQSDPEASVFLSSDAGGQGVDLPQASVLINYNLPWSAGTALQRNSRIIRASSQHPQVRVERILTKDTLEIRQWEALRYKISVSEGIVDGVLSDPSGSLESGIAGLAAFLLLDS